MFSCNPCGDIEKGKRSKARVGAGAWDEQWRNLSQQQQEAAHRLGYTQDSWDHHVMLPFEERAWDLLSDEEKAYLAFFQWNQYSWDGAWKKQWDQLSRREQMAASRLHYTKVSWNENHELQFLKLPWRKLTQDQQEALRVFKFDQAHWDDYVGGKATEADPLMKKVAPPKLYTHGARVYDCPLVTASGPSKQSFITQAYGIVLGMLVMAFLVSFPIMQNPSGALEFFSTHLWLLFIVIFIWVIQILIYVAVLAALKVYGDKILLDGYVVVLGQKPWVCMVYAFFFTVCSALIIALVLAAFNLANICIVYMYTAFNIVGLYFFMWAFQRKADFSTMYGYLVPVFGAVIMALFTKWLMTNPTGLSLDRYIALFLSIGLGWIIVFDTQVIFGEKHEKGRKYPYYTDQWCLAGYEMYFDFIFFSFQSLKLIPGPANV
jgi:hypothetical protein